MTKTTSFWERLQEAMAENALETENLTAAAGLIGKHYTAATKWRDGGYPSMKNTVQLAQTLGVSVEWLLTGEGSKRPVPPIPDDARELLDYWALLGPEDRTAALRYIKTMSRAAFTGDPDKREEHHQRLAKLAKERDQAKTKGKP